MKNIVLYYHIYLTDDSAAWSSIFLEQMKCMQDSSLLKNLSVMKITAIAQKDSRRDEFFNLCRLYDVKGEIDWVDNPYPNDYLNLLGIDTNTAITENHTYRKIYRDCLQNDCIVAYIHSKGITSYLKHLKTCDHIYTETFKRYYYWRQFLNWGAIENWSYMVKALETHDTAGVNFQINPSPHYSGSFWWANSSWITQLPDPATRNWWQNLKLQSRDSWLATAYDRFADEQWLTHKPNVRAWNITENSDLNPAFHLLTTDKYPRIRTIA